ncbi:MAG: cation-transporting P-type ATPase, partial [Proteobacteria bacterium]|nr:cation-transporting P-type ATPase [Pseudomonadota bacterium]
MESVCMSTSKESYSGLTSHEAGVRLNQTGPNQLESSKPRSVFSIAVDTVREPMFLLLLACSLLYLALGDLGEALILSSAIFVVMFITFVQERRTERTLDALRDLSSPRALVMRDGVPLRIAGKDVVPDDLVLIQEGDRIPADGFVLMSTALKID